MEIVEKKFWWGDLYRQYERERLSFWRLSLRKLIAVGMIKSCVRVKLFMLPYRWIPSWGSWLLDFSIEWRRFGRMRKYSRMVHVEWVRRHGYNHVAEWSIAVWRLEFTARVPRWVARIGNKWNQQIMNRRFDRMMESMPEYDGPNYEECY